MKAGLDSAVEEDADGPEMEKDVKSDDAYDKHTPMLSMIKNGTSYYGVSRCIRRYSTVVVRQLAMLRTAVRFCLPAQGNIQQDF